MKDKIQIIINKIQKFINTKYKKYIVIILLSTIILNLLGCIDKFCEFYKNYIYGYIASIVGFILSPIPFPVGEILMYIGAIMIIALVVILFVLIFLRKKAGYVSFTKKYIKTALAIVCTVMFIYTTNWILPFRAPHLDVKPEIDKKYSVEEMQILRNYTVNQLNSIAESIDRDENGRIVLSENLRKDISQSMNNISDEFPLLKGYYPNAKASLCSGVLEWMGIGGYTYPYTMEVSYNKYNGYLYDPVLISHEQSHHKGYYQENEATFLSIIACIKSDSKYLQYAGYLELYYYIENDYVDSMFKVYEDDLAYEMIMNQPMISDQVKQDRIDSYNQSQELYEKEVSKFFENLFKESAEEVGDAGWEAQGEIIGEATYSGSVKYLLEYFDGVLY